MERLEERLAIARRALKTLAELCALPSASAVERDAAIQRFAYSFEAAWKAAQLYLKDREGVDVASPNPTVSQAAEGRPASLGSGSKCSFTAV